MSDELTPEELEALKNLPRERMPSAGLEDRVVGAMHQHGILGTKRSGRVVRLTRSRYAGLIAATIVLMVGAYSIGLHRGGDNEVLRSVQKDNRTDEIAPMSIEESARGSLAAESSQPPAPLAANEPMSQQAKPELEWKLKTTEAEPQTTAVKKEIRLQRMEPPASAAPAEDMSTRDDKLAQGRAREATPPEVQSDAAASREMSQSMQLQAGKPDAKPGPRQRAFFINGTKFIIDAPDSVRVVEDEAGRMLLIYTSDGIIRIRLSD